MKSIKRVLLPLLAVAVAGLAMSATASAHSGEYARFNYCPSTNPTVFKCLQATTTGGEVVLGKKKVPIVHPVVLQGGVTEESEETLTSGFVGATNGVTLSKAAQPVPGGLTGLVNCKEISLSWLRSSCEGVLENGLTGVNATLELARPASSIVVSESDLAIEEGTALQLPVRIHLENPLLGSGCYVGSSTTPLIWNLSTGFSKPPAGTAPIRGTSGKLLFIDEGLLAHFTGAKLVDNGWSAPGATGCGGFLAELILDPIINSQIGLPSAAGKNVSILNNEIYLAQAAVVNTK
jgi:hypothetical protein